LIAPITLTGAQVTGGPKTYYYWSRDGDLSNDKNTNQDRVNHDVLDGIFQYDSNGVMIAKPDTTDVFRYAKLSGVGLALPTAPPAGDLNTDGSGFRQSTTTGAGEVSDFNKPYDLSAIWDAYCDPLSGSGVPLGWDINYSFWSATYASGSGSAAVHQGFNLGNGSTTGTVDNAKNYHVILQVI